MDKLFVFRPLPSPSGGDGFFRIWILFLSYILKDISNLSVRKNGISLNLNTSSHFSTAEMVVCFVGICGTCSFLRLLLAEGLAKLWNYLSWYPFFHLLFFTVLKRLVSAFATTCHEKIIHLDDKSDLYFYRFGRGFDNTSFDRRLYVTGSHYYIFNECANWFFSCSP